MTEKKGQKWTEIYQKKESPNRQGTKKNMEKSMPERPRCKIAVKTPSFCEKLDNRIKFCVIQVLS